MTPPMFSVITICLNNKDGLIRTYQSLKSQSCDDYEWIIVDGVSTDGTVEFLKSLPKTDMISWKSEADSGLYDAMNKGMALARGDYLLFLNSGDELTGTDVLEVVKANALQNSKPSLIYGDALELCQDGSCVRKNAYSWKRVWYGMFTHHQSIFYSRKKLGKQNYRLDYRIAADYAFTCEFLMRVDDVHYVDVPICLFEGGGLTSSGKVHIEGMREQWKIGRDIMKRSFVQRLGVLSAHLVKHVLKRVSPKLYKWMRYKEI